MLLDMSPRFRPLLRGISELQTSHGFITDFLPAHLGHVILRVPSRPFTDGVAPGGAAASVVMGSSSAPGDSGGCRWWVYFF